MANEIKRDLALLHELSNCGGDMWIGPAELACLLGLSHTSVQQQKVSIPPRDPRTRRLRWNLGEVREWMRGENRPAIQPPPKSPKKKKRGAPTKRDRIQNVIAEKLRNSSTIQATPEIPDSVQK